MTDAYGLLGITPAATPEEVKAAHRRLARIHHPDRYVSADEQARVDAADRMAELNAALRAVEEGVGTQWRAADRSATGATGSEREVMFRRWEEADRGYRVVASGTHVAEPEVGHQVEAPQVDGSSLPHVTRERPVDPATEIWEQRNERVAKQAQDEVERMATEQSARRVEAEREREEWRAAVDKDHPKKRRIFKKRWER